MSKYKVTVTSTVTHILYVDADTKDEAIELADEQTHEIFMNSDGCFRGPLRTYVKWEGYDSLDWIASEVEQVPDED